MLISHEELFLSTVQDLRTKIRLNTTYSLIRACGLCRHLLLDEHPLLHQVNRKYKLLIRFHIKDFDGGPLSYDYKGSGGRTILPLGDSKMVKLEEFLQTKIHYNGKNEYTVRDILNTACHYYGGIHSGKPDSKQENLAKLNRFYHKETNASVWHMRGICKVILKAMRALEKQIRAHISTGGFSPQSSAA